MVFTLDEEFPNGELHDPPPELIVNGTCIMRGKPTVGLAHPANFEVLSFSDEDDGIGSTHSDNQPYHKNLMRLNPVAIPVPGKDYSCQDENSDPVMTISSIRRKSSGSYSAQDSLHRLNINSGNYKKKYNSTSNNNNNSNKALSGSPNYLSASPRDALCMSIPKTNGVLARRRSSVLSRLSINTPPNVMKFDMIHGKNDCAVYDENDEDNQIDQISLEDGNNGGIPISSHGQPIPQTTKTSPHVKRKLEDFDLVRVLGQGAYGKVILVKDQYNAKLYAMKQLKKAEILLLPDDEDEKVEGQMSPRSKRLERTFAERTILSQLDHPNIVKLFYSFHDKDKLYLLLQYLPGGELFFHLKNLGNLQEDTVAFYTAEISLAVKFLHDRGIVYRDLKPENCLLNERGHLVVTDFGLSKKSTSNNDGNFYSIIGTPEYAAPELLQGISYTKACDWYSLGCLVYDMLLGKPPHTGQNPKAILNKIMKNTINIPYYLSDGMKDFLNALLKKDIEKRWNVDQYWDEVVNNNKKTAAAAGGKRGGKKKKAGAAKTTGFKQHFIFRKINWKDLDNVHVQKTTWGPILPVITDWSLAENFDLEFTEQRLTNADIRNVDVTANVSINDNSNGNTKKHDELFEGFSFMASSSYLEKYF